jgi:quinoprotein glucose dehydrogenase
MPPARSIASLALFTLFCVTASGGQATDAAGWPTYGGDAGGQRYSSARQITPDNVNRLRVAWEYHTGALTSHRPGSKSASFEATPILHDNTLFFATPFNEIVALNASTGAKQWTYDPHVKVNGEGALTTSRGVAFWQGTEGANGPCRSRIIEGTMDGRLLAVDATNGTPCKDFGQGGEVTLETAEIAFRKGDHIPVTSAPAVVGDVVIVGSSISDNATVDIERGTVRGYDARTGRELWGWDPLPWANSQAVRTGAGNTWGPIAVDPELGLVFLPTGSPSPDYYGGLRVGDDADADSVVALDAKTGRKVWAFQLVHHDLWDYDVAAEPLLFTLHGSIPAVAVSNKSGMVYVLDRRTGKPLYPVEERAVPQSDVPGEHSWPTQPFSSLPRLGPDSPFVSDAAQWGRSPAHQAECDQRIATLRYRGMFTPPSLQGSLEFPGKLGGVNWGSMAYDPETGRLYANNNRFPYEVRLIPKPVSRHATLLEIRRALGQQPYPYVIALSVLLSAFLMRRHRNSAIAIAVVGVALLGFAINLHRKQLKSTAENNEKALHTILGVDDSPQNKTPYGLYLRPVSDSAGLPCSKQPWAAITSLDLEKGTKSWENTLGTMVDGEQTGSVELGGPMVTAGGLVFTAGTVDPYLRGFDKRTGKEIWKQRLPVPAQATPMSYTAGGRQYVVIAAGGHGLFNTVQGDSVIAFALPE